MLVHAQATLDTEFYTDCSRMNKFYKCLYFCRLPGTCHCTCLLVLVLCVHSWCVAGKWIHIGVVGGKTNGISKNSQYSRNGLDARWPHCRCKLDIYIFVAQCRTSFILLLKKLCCIMTGNYICWLYVFIRLLTEYAKISRNVQIQIWHTNDAFDNVSWNNRKLLLTVKFIGTQS